MKHNILFIFIFSAFICNSQTVLDVDLNFKSGWYSNITIRDFEVQPDGKVIVVGDFITFNDKACYGIIRLNTDFSVDTTFHFGSGFNHTGWRYVNTVKLQPDGKILVGGIFDHYNGAVAKDLLRLNSDGTIDLTFSAGDGVANDMGDDLGQVYSIDVNDDGKILVAGTFRRYDEITVNNIVLLNSDGSIDESFESGDAVEGTYFDLPRVYDAQFIADNKIFLAGTFDYYNNISRKDALRIFIDGSEDTSYHPVGICAADSDGKFTQFHVNDDGSIYLAGDFGCYGAYDAEDFIKVKSNGAFDTAFNNNLDFAVCYESYLSYFFLLPDNTICVAQQSCYNSYITALNTNGTPNTAFDTITFNISRANPAYDGIVLAEGDTAGEATVNKVVLINDSTMFVAGLFNKILFNDTLTRRNCIAKMQIQDGVNDNYPGAGFDHGEVNTMVETDDHKILAAGYFFNYDNHRAASIVRLFEDTGAIDTSFHSGSGFNGVVKKLILLNDGKILAVGGFTKYNGIDARKICRLYADGELDESFSSGTGLYYPDGYTDTAEILDAVITMDGKIIIGGVFLSYDDHPCNYIARLNSDGSFDDTFLIGSGTNNSVNDIELQSTGKILIAGYFNEFDDNYKLSLARLNTDGSLDESFHTGLTPGSGVYHVRVTNTDKIYIAGAMTSYDGVTRYSVARLSADGYLDLGFNPGEAFVGDWGEEVFDITLQPDGKVIICAIDYEPGSLERAEFKRLKADGSYDSGFGSYSFYEFGTHANDILLTDSMDIYIAGPFRRFQNVTRDCFAKIKGVPYVCVPSYASITATICAGEPYILPSGEIVFEAGVYTDTIETIYACDSIITVNLAHSPLYSGSADIYVCEGEAYELFNGELIYDEGIYTDSANSVLTGCDSIVTITLYHNAVTEYALEAAICDGETYILPDGESATESGIYIDTFSSVFTGCDSIITTNLLVHPSFLFTDSVVIHEGEIFTLPDGTISSIPGVYTTAFETTEGCDSVYITVLDVVTDIQENNFSNEMSLNIQPNPSNGSFQVSLISNGIPECNFYITDLLGKIMTTGNLQLSNGDNTFEFDLDDIKSGLYIFKVNYGTEIMQACFVITQ